MGFFSPQFLIWSRSRSNRRQILVLPQWTLNRLPLNEAGTGEIIPEGRKKKTKNWDASSGKDGFLCFGIVEIFNMQEGKTKVDKQPFRLCTRYRYTQSVSVHIYTHSVIIMHICVSAGILEANVAVQTTDCRGAVLSNVVQSSRPDQKNTAEKSMFNFLRKLVINCKPSAGHEDRRVAENSWTEIRPQRSVIRGQTEAGSL